MLKSSKELEVEGEAKKKYTGIEAIIIEEWL